MLKAIEMIFEDGGTVVYQATARLHEKDEEGHDTLSYAGFAFHDFEQDPDGRATAVFMWELHPEGRNYRVTLTDARTEEPWAMPSGEVAAMLVPRGQHIGEAVAAAIDAALELVE